LHNPSSPKIGQIAQLIQATIEEASIPSKALKTLGEMVAQVLNGETNMASLLKNVKKSKRAKVEARMLDVDTIIRRQSTQCVDQLKLTAGDSALFINGRLVGPLASNETLVSGDLHAVVTSDLDMGIARKVRRLVDEAEFTSLSPDDDTSDYRSALISHAATLVSGHLKKRGEISQYSPDLSKLDQLRDKLTGFDAGEELRAAGGYYHDVLAIVNPLSNDAQKFAPLLSYFADNCAIAVRVILNPNPRLSELPLKRFYRYVVPASEPVFGIDGAFRHGATAIFNNLPSAPLLTLGMDTPASWMIQATRSIHDLDNIHLDSAKRGVHAVFSLEYVVAWCSAVSSRTGEEPCPQPSPCIPPFSRYILIQGSCVDAQTRSPVAGLELQVGTLGEGRSSDTLVMANLGYFQLRASAGLWHLRIRPGRSDTIYEIDSVEGGELNSSRTSPVIALRDYMGRHVRLRVIRRPGQARTPLLDPKATGSVPPSPKGAAEGDENKGMWNTLSNFFSGPEAAKPRLETFLGDIQAQLMGPSGSSKASLAESK
jgi:UDP-glucose:glycoprotein glucosyltransferase